MTASAGRDLPRAPLARFIAAAAGARTVEITAIRLLAGGAVCQHWLIELILDGGPFAGRQHWVLRTDGATSLGMGLARGEEFALLRALHAAGLAVPSPFFVCCDTAPIGKPFLLMQWLPGTAVPESVLARVAAGDGDALAERLGRELARLHAIRPPRPDLHFLGAPPSDPAAARLDELAGLLDADAQPHPVAEWGLRWLRRNTPRPAAPALCHGDFRTGNFLVDGGALAAVLDWEFAGWSDPDEDIGWFCSRCWRFGRPHQEAGGLASRDAFYRGYAAESGRIPDPARVRFWEAAAALRWLVIALRQRDRCLRQGEPSLDLALTGRRVAECEMAILLLTAEKGCAA